MLQLSEYKILTLHTILETLASNPILKTHFFELRENAVCKKFIFYGALYALQNSMCSDKLYVNLIYEKAVKKTPYQSG